MRTGFRFVPLVMLALATALALTLLYVDERVDPGIKASLAWAYSGGPEGARSLLSTIAGSMITAASVTFSLASVRCRSPRNSTVHEFCATSCATGSPRSCSALLFRLLFTVLLWCAPFEAPIFRAASSLLCP